MKHPLILLTALLLAAPAMAQPLAAPDAPNLLLGIDDPLLGVDDPTCADGAVLDDGTRESGYGWVPSVTEGQYLQEFQPRLFPNRELDSVCVCWLRTNTNDSTINFEVVFYESMPNPEPDPSDSCLIIPTETPFAVVPATAQGVTSEGNFYRIDTSGVNIPTEPFYIGMRWDASADRFFFLCSDKSPTTPAVPGFLRDERSEGWTSAFKTADPIFDDYRSLMIRARATGLDVIDVPALRSWGLVAFVVVLMGVGVWRLRQGG